MIALRTASRKQDKSCQKVFWILSSVYKRAWTHVIIHCLEVSCKEDQNHERAARVIYLRTTDRQTVNYYSTIHAMGLIYFDSNTQ